MGKHNYVILMVYSCSVVSIRTSGDHHQRFQSPCPYPREGLAILIASSWKSVYYVIQTPNFSSVKLTDQQGVGSFHSSFSSWPQQSEQSTRQSQLLQHSSQLPLQPLASQNLLILDFCWWDWISLNPGQLHAQKVSQAVYFFALISLYRPSCWPT